MTNKFFILVSVLFFLVAQSSAQILTSAERNKIFQDNLAKFNSLKNITPDPQIISSLQKPTETLSFYQQNSPNDLGKFGGLSEDAFKRDWAIAKLRDSSLTDKFYNPLTGQTEQVTASNYFGAVATQRYFNSEEGVKDYLGKIADRDSALAAMQSVASQDRELVKKLGEATNKTPGDVKRDAAMSEALRQDPSLVMTDGKFDQAKFDALKKRLQATPSDQDSINEELEKFRNEALGIKPLGSDPDLAGVDPIGGGAPGGGGADPAAAPAAPPEFDTTEINAAICDIFDLMEGGLGALLSVAAGVGALFAMAFGAYKAGYGLIVVAAAGFVVRSFVAIFFGSFDCAV